MCFYHPKVESGAACRRCMIPLCEDCTRDRYCPECHKMALYVRQGHSGNRPANLVVEDNQRRASLTRQLMINRLANNVLGELPPVAPGPVAGGARKSLKRAGAPRSAPGRQAPPLGALGGSVIALCVAFALGALVARPPAPSGPGVAEAAMAPDEPAAPAPVGQAGNRPGGDLPPTYVYAETPSLSESTRDGTLRASRTVGGTERPAATPGDGLVPALPAPAQEDPPTALVPDLPAPPPSRPALNLAWPVAGNTLRLTSYVKVHVTDPGRVSVLNVTVDGKPFAPVGAVSGRTEVPIDTTRIENGDHRLQLVAMTEAGELITSEAVPVTVSN